MFFDFSPSFISKVIKFFFLNDFLTISLYFLGTLLVDIKITFLTPESFCLYKI